MSVFIVGVVGLLLLASALILLRRDAQPRSADLADPNLGWYRQRRAELSDADPTLVEEVELRLLEEGSLDGSASGAVISRPLGRLSLVLLSLAIALISVLIYQRTGAVEDVLIYRDLSSLSADTSDASRDALLQRIEDRSRDRSENLHYLGLLGRMHMAAEDYAAASSAFERLAEQAPEDPQALALAAQARFLAAGRKLDNDSQLLAEQSLAVDPSQRTALGLLGMASFEAGSYAAAVTYWERLQAQEPVDSPGYKMLGDVLALARERGGMAVADAGVATPTDIDESGPGITVDLALHGAARAAPDAVVFVFARRAGATGGMPVAVRRLTAGQLPVRLRLEDGDAMAGQLLSEAGPVVVSAQISSNGQPGPANALYVAASDSVRAAPGAAVAIQLGAPAHNGSDATVAVAPAEVATQAGITVELSLAESLEVPGDAVVYVFARRAGMAGGMPVAVRRLRAGQLPLTLRLVDGDAMAGQLLSEAGQVVVSVQISANGQPGVANALYSAASTPVTAANDSAVSIQLGATGP